MLVFLGFKNFINSRNYIDQLIFDPLELRMKNSGNFRDLAEFF